MLAEKLDQKKSSLEKQLLNMRTDLKSCVSQMDSLKVSVATRIIEIAR